MFLVERWSSATPSADPGAKALVNVAIGVSGLEALEYWRGCPDRDGRRLRGHCRSSSRRNRRRGRPTIVMHKAGGIPLALINGLEWRAAEGTTRHLQRDPARDLFRSPRNSGG
jgi:F420-0:gamma-glutamyl ligase